MSSRIFRLERETLRKLTRDELQFARGGMDRAPTGGGGDVSKKETTGGANPDDCGNGERTSAGTNDATDTHQC
jgi:hypothetical protein